MVAVWKIIMVVVVSLMVAVVLHRGRRTTMAAVVGLVLLEGGLEKHFETLWRFVST